MYQQLSLTKLKRMNFTSSYKLSTPRCHDMICPPIEDMIANWWSITANVGQAMGQHTYRFDSWHKEKDRLANFFLVNNCVARATNNIVKQTDICLIYSKITRTNNSQLFRLSFWQTWNENRERCTIIEWRLLYMFYIFFKRALEHVLKCL